MNVAPYRMKCSGWQNYEDMKQLLETLCHKDYTLDQLSSSRIRKIYGGKCVWVAHYKLINFTNTLIGKQAFAQGIVNLTADLPIGAKVVSSGRYSGQSFGVLINLGHIHCVCPLDFRCAMTLIRLTELREITHSYEVEDTTIADAQLKDFFFGKFDCIGIVWADGDPFFQRVIREQQMMQLAVFAYNASVKTMAVVVNEVRCFEDSQNVNRLKNIKKKLFEFFNQNDLKSKEIVTFANLTLLRPDMENNRNLPPLTSKINMLNNCVIINFKNSCNEIFSVAIGFIDFQIVPK